MHSMCFLVNWFNGEAHRRSDSGCPTITPKRALVRICTKYKFFQKKKRKLGNTWPAAFLTNVVSSLYCSYSKTFPHPGHELQTIAKQHHNPIHNTPIEILHVKKYYKYKIKLYKQKLEYSHSTTIANSRNWLSTVRAKNHSLKLRANSATDFPQLGGRATALFVSRENQKERKNRAVS